MVVGDEHDDPPGHGPARPRPEAPAAPASPPRAPSPPSASRPPTPRAPASTPGPRPPDAASADEPRPRSATSRITRRRRANSDTQIVAAPSAAGRCAAPPGPPGTPPSPAGPSAGRSGSAWNRTSTPLVRPGEHRVAAQRADQPAAARSGGASPSITALSSACGLAAQRGHALDLGGGPVGSRPTSDLGRAGLGPDAEQLLRDRVVQLAGQPGPLLEHPTAPARARRAGRWSARSRRATRTAPSSPRRAR